MKIPKLLIGLAVFFITHHLSATIIKTHHFDIDQLQIRQKNGFHHLTYENFELSSEPGTPQLPYELVHFSENNLRIDSIVITQTDYVKLDGEFKLFPAQKPQILSMKKVDFQPLSLHKTGPKTFCPGQAVEVLHGGNFNDHFINGYRLFPLQYNVRTGELFFLKNITLEIATRPGPLTKKRSANHPVRQKIVSHLAGTPQANPGTPISRSESTVDYLIITSVKLSSYFMPLQEWKMKKGLRTEIVTTEWIAENYSGRDIQEKIRNLIKDYHQNKATVWVLLGGDTNFIPDRKAWAFDCEANYASGENDIPCDLYFSDLDGNWDADHDDIFGEVEDNIDIYPDVFVGRAPVENIQEAEAFVKKILAYEKAVNTDYQANALFLAQVLWKDPYTDSGESKNLIDELYLPDQFDPVNKLYESKSNASKNNIIEKILSGMNIINHDGHAWYSIMSVGQGSLGYTDMANLNNTDKYGFIYSIGCWPAAIDKHAVAEDFITNPEGGGIAFIGNSRYGWGSPGNPLFGYSDRFDQQFFRQLFDHDIHHIGATLAATKSFFAPLSAQENVYRWCQYELNLLGDPELMIYTDLPKQLSLNFPQNISTGNQKFAVSVTHDGTPVEHCKLCVYQEDGAYFVTNTGTDGIAIFDGLVENTSEKLYLTATAHNFVPFEDSIEVNAEQPFLTFSRIDHDDLFSSSLLLNERLTISPVLKNFGNSPAENITITLSSENPKISMADTAFTVDYLNIRDSIILTEAFSFQLQKNVIDREKIIFTAEINDDQGEGRYHEFSITAQLPDLTINSVSVNKSGLLAGDNFLCGMIVKNNGSHYCGPYHLSFSGLDSLTINEIYLSTEGLYPGETDTIFIDMSLSDRFTGLNYISANIDFITMSGYHMNSEILFNVGDFGFFDDVENGLVAWNLPGQNSNQWHQSTNRKFSGIYSFYCGDEETYIYDAAAGESILESEYFYPGRQGKLSFYCWYEFPNYGTSGLNVEVLDSARWKQLDFIGSGGALGMLPAGNDWLRYEYDLAFLPDFSKTKVRFRVDLDSAETATEGVYIDDIQVIENPVRVTNVAGAKKTPAAFKLYQNFPNPFNTVTTIKFVLPEAGHAKILIYNIIGEKVGEIHRKNYLPGLHSVIFNAKDLSSGIYFYKLESEKYTDVRKFLFIK